ncbi:uncharacterized protein [Haliotis cracherodii]|uniref:uncharacterized protein n=1 Tax=Haliotis cracherodii TaxID=6455 RepID=UPI0039EA41AA
MMAENQAIYQMGITPGMEYIMGPEGSQAEQEALREDKDQSYRVILNIVGRERQGKTSLRKMLAWQEFCENEESTVGIDHELVETCGVQPESSWSQLDMHMANEKEFDVIIGKHVLKRLKKKASRISIGKVVAPVVCFAKIAAVTYLILGLYLSAVSLEGLKGYPWVGIIVIGLFCASGLAFGTREGFGIAVGIFHQVLLCEALLRWDVGGTVFKKLKSEFGSTCAIFMGFLCYGIGETCVAFSFGMSLGVGIVCTFCLAHPPQTTGEHPSQLFLSPHLHMFILGCYVGLGSVNYRSVLLYVIAPLLAIAIHALPEDYAFLLMCGLGTGHFHGVGLLAGQNTYYVLNTNIKRITDSPRCRRFIRHFLGATPGLFMIYLFNWNLSVISWDYVFMSLSVVATIEILNSLATRTKAVCPVKNPSKVIGARVFNTSLKLVLRDFAGHPLYYTAHHLYMTGQCMYLLVFNMLDATKNFDFAFAYLLQWLYSIYVHHDYPDIRVFIIGTHRNDPSLNQSVIMKLGHRLKEALPRQFHNIVVWNEDDTPLFPVENSVRNDKDSDHLNLRSRILREVRYINVTKYPLKYFYFFKLIENFRKEQILIKKYEDVYKICKENDCLIESEEDFEELLKFFSNTGEILYISKDNILREFIIFNPHVIVKILSQLMTVPKMSHRERHILEDWERLETFGICTEKLFRENMPSANIFGGFEKAVYLLESFNLLCKIQTKPGQAMQDRLFLIPALLPKVLPFPDNYWPDASKDHIFFVQCVPALPRSAFLRLVCRCAAFDDSIISDDQIIVLNACQTKALFSYRDMFSYKLEMLDSSTPKYQDKSPQAKCSMSSGFDAGSLPTPDKQFLRIVIRCETGVDYTQMLNLLWELLTRIVKRDFAKCKLKLGVECPCEPPHQDMKHQTGFHILSLGDDDFHDEDTNHQRLMTKHYWCRGRKVAIRNGKASLLLGQERQVFSPDGCKMTTQLSDLPYTLTGRVCDYLNIPNALGKDWRYLAGMLGKTSHEVDLITFRCPRDPCGALLNEWVSTHPRTSVADLVIKLKDMERLDVISILGFDWENV